MFIFTGMKTFFIAIAFLGLTVIGHAQSKNEQAVATAAEKLRKAMVDGDSLQLSAIADARLTYGHSSGKIEDKATFVNTIASGKSDFVTIDISNQRITVAGNTAVVRHRLDATTNDGGKPGTVKLDILLVWQKEKGKWKLLARQAVKVQ